MLTSVVLFKLFGNWKGYLFTSDEFFTERSVNGISQIYTKIAVFDSNKNASKDNNKNKNDYKYQDKNENKIEYRKENNNNNNNDAFYGFYWNVTAWL